MARPCWRRATSVRRLATTATAITAPLRRKWTRWPTPAAPATARSPSFSRKPRCGTSSKAKASPVAPPATAIMRFASPRTISWACRGRILRPLPRAREREIRRHARRRQGRRGHPCRSRSTSRTGSTRPTQRSPRPKNKGMEVSEPKFNLQKASDALTNARTQIHSFKVDVVKKALADGEKVVDRGPGQGRPRLGGIPVPPVLAGGLAGSDPDSHRAAVALYPHLADSRETGGFQGEGAAGKSVARASAKLTLAGKVRFCHGQKTTALGSSLAFGFDLSPPASIAKANQQTRTSRSRRPGVLGRARNVVPQRRSRLWLVRYSLS